MRGWEAGRLGGWEVIAVMIAACGGGSASPKASDAAAVAVVRDAAAVVPRADEDPHAYKAALHRGWELARKGDDQGALAAFRDAYAASPGDARALTEMSWEELLTGDVANAATDADHALAATSDPKLQAMALYNRGRAEEATGKLEAARADYQQSLTLRPNRSVERRLGRIASAGAGAPTPAPAVAPGETVLSGPFADFAGFCADLGLPVADSDDPTLEDDVWCQAEGDAATAPSPFDRAEVLRHSDGGGVVTTDLALHAAKGWWVAVDVGASRPSACNIKKSEARCSFP